MRHYVKLYDVRNFKSRKAYRILMDWTLLLVRISSLPEVGKEGVAPKRALYNIFGFFSRVSQHSRTSNKSKLLLM